MRSMVEGNAVLKIIAPKAEGRTVPKARRLRKDMSLPEVLLWRVLRTRPYGLKFRRQHGSGEYVLDFFCADARLAIEIDGFAHQTEGRPERDASRDAWFGKAGVQTLRIPAAAVLKDIDSVTEQIVEAVRARLPLHHPAAPGGPPPRDELGEDLT